MIKSFSKLLPVSLLLLACGTTQAQKKPNILLIAIDDMNNWIGAMEHKAKTPNIDALANSGVLFNNAYCAVPACNPSRVALLTGLRPQTTGQYENEGNFREKPGGADRVTLPQYLQKVGYETVAAGKIFHQPNGISTTPSPLSDPVSWNFQQPGLIGTPGAKQYVFENGFAKWIDGAEQQYIDPAKGNSGMNYMCKNGIWGPIPQSKEECGDWKMAGFIADYLGKDHDKPFMLAYGIFRPHSPQLAPQEYFDRYPIESIELPECPANDMDDIPAIAQTNWSSPFVKLVKEKNQWKNAVQGYLACMSFADDCVGRVMKALDKSKYRDNTIVIFVTDHGWQLGHKNRWEKFSLWHQATNAPLVIRYPEMKSAGQVCNKAVSFIDLYPTITDIIGIEKNQANQGISLLPWLENPKLDRTVPAIITYPEKSYSLVLDNWNYIQYSDGSEELYDHNIDPHEFKNLAGNDDLKAKLVEYRSLLEATLGINLKKK